MPTLAPPVFDTGGSSSGPLARQGSARRPLTILLVFLGTLVVTVVVLRLVLGPFGGAEPTDGGPTTSAGQPATTGGAGTGTPSATVVRPADVRRAPDVLAPQFLREFLTRQPGESPAQVVERLGDLVAPEYASALPPDPSGAERPGSLVEVGTASVVDPDIYEVEVRPWAYGPDDAVADAVPAGRQVWRIAVRADAGLWSVTAAQVV